MKIAGWCATRVSAHVTEILTALGLVCAISHNKQVMLGSNYLSDTMPRDYFVGRRAYERNMYRGKYCFSYGETDYFRCLWDERKSKKKIESSSGMLRDRVCFVQPPDYTEGSLFDEEISKRSIYFVSVFGHGQDAFRYLMEADKIMVFLPSEEREVEVFFDYYHFIIDKCVFLLEEDTGTNKRIITELVEKHSVDPEKICVIPRSIGFEKACINGEVDDFMLKNIYGSDSDTFYFIHQIKRAAKLILNQERNREAVCTVK